MTTPRPDQHHTQKSAGSAGSRSGSGDTAAALGYPGVPPAIPNCQAFTALQLNVATSGIIGTFPAPGRVWMVLLSYTITSNNSYSLATSRTVATVTTSTSLTLAVVQLGVAGANQHESDTAVVPWSGLPVVQGESVTLTINGGNPVTNLDQQASAVVLYSTP